MRGSRRGARGRRALAAVAALPDDFRDVLVAVDITGLSSEEAAKALRIREDTVMSRLYRARQQVVRRIDGARPDERARRRSREHLLANRPARRRPARG